MRKNVEYETIIGLEVHVQLSTRTKIFCGCSTGYAYQAPNTYVCPVCLGLPGVLPVLDREVLVRAVRTVLAVGGAVAEFSKFDRKNYFYPDLPKAYQISQYDRPIGRGGSLEIRLADSVRTIRIDRIHMEEDAGKLIHEDGSTSLVDYNRAGVPLLEIVTLADLRGSEEARVFLMELKTMLEYLEVSTCNMEEGTLRCDANVSIRPVGQEALGTRAEIKNLNSFKFVAQAIDHEVTRQKEVLERGEAVVQETRLWDADRRVTRSMRGKEEAQDYRYFPEPDLPPIVLDREEVETIRQSLPELPRDRRSRFVERYGLPPYDAGVLTGSRAMADFYEEAVAAHDNPKSLSNWMMTELLGRMNEQGLDLDRVKVRPNHLAGLVRLIDEGTLSGKMAKDVFDEMFTSGRDPGALVAEKGLKQITDEGLVLDVVTRVLDGHPGVLADVLGGKEKARGFLVGQVMKETRGKANPKLVNSILEGAIAKRRGGG